MTATPSCAAVVLAAILLTDACTSSDATAPSSPSTPTSSAASTATFTLSGRITDALSGLPLQGVSVYVNPTTLSKGQFFPWPGVTSIPSDAGGRYTVSG